MNPELNDTEFDAKLKERFAQLPKVVQDAITSADVEKRMRALADTNKLHLDQWNALENEVMLSLLGFQPIGELEKNIKAEVGVSDEIAKSLAQEISKIVFEPIRQELERHLDHPEAKGESLSAVEAVGKEAVRAETAPAVQPATPAPAPNEAKSVRAPVSEVYKPGQTSIDRKQVHDDPYRETP